MKVLFVSLLTYDKIGGIETFNKYFIESLKTNNIEIVVVSYHDKNSFDNVIACNSSLFVLVKSIFREMEATDIIVWSHINLLPVFFLFKQLTNSKKVLITHGIEVWYKLSWGKEFMLNRMDYILSVSNYTKDKLVNVCSILPEKVKIFPNCIKLKNKTKQKNPFDKKKFNILTLLRVDESYKLQSIINILNAMDELEDREINFTIIGKGNRLEYIQEEINKRNLSKQVFLKGFIEDTSKYLEHCDVFTLISDREGFGIVYLEAMEYRKPCFFNKLGE